MVSKMSPSHPSQPASPSTANATAASAAGASAADKLCAVCGDKALGYNFNAVTCESCKAFFRRNALTNKPLQCPFSERCDITVVTRRFCQKCRLVKCFGIGMRKEYIMSEEDKILKKIKIEQNRTKRKPSSSSSSSSSSPGGSTTLGGQQQQHDHHHHDNDTGIRVPAKIKRVVASMMRMQEDDNNGRRHQNDDDDDHDDDDGADANAPDTDVALTQLPNGSATPSSSTCRDDDVTMAAAAAAQSPAGMSQVISSSSGESPGRGGNGGSMPLPTLASSSTAIVDRLVNYPEDSSKLINHLMKTPSDAVLVMTKIINSQKDAMRLIGHLIGAPGDALKIISKIMNSPFDALTVFTKFMSSPTDALEIIAKIASSPGEVLQFIQQLMNSPEDALQIMHKFMNSPAEALKMLNKMVNNPSADSTTTTTAAASAVGTETLRAPDSDSHPMIKSMLNEGAAPATAIATDADIAPNNSAALGCEDLQATASPPGGIAQETVGKLRTECIREILEEAQDAPIAANTLESVICDVISLEYDLGRRSPAVASGSVATRELNDAERAKLNELIVANKALYAPLDEDLSGLDECSGGETGGRNPQDPQLLKIINLTAIAIRRLIKMSKRINAFRNLCQEDQVALLKGGCTEMMILRSAFQYDSTHAKWQVNTRVPNSQEAMSSITVDVLKLAKGNIYEVHESFIRTFEPKWRQDENIILILSAIVLFTPDRPRTVHADVLRLEQHSYYYLLRRYLESVFGGCEARSTFLKLVQKVRDLQQLKDEFVGVYLDVNPNQVEPLLWEMFDLKNQ